jgi:hypothetical protein
MKPLYKLEELMKKLMALIVMIFSLTAFAKENVSFTYFGNEGFSHSYYACSYVEDQANAYLQLFGATNIEVYCNGGIQPWGSVQPVSLDASFDLPVVAGHAVEAVKIDGDTFHASCGINVRIIKELLKKFTNITVVKKDDACGFVDSNYHYELNIAH